MKKVLDSIHYYVLYGLWYGWSLLPLWFHYAMSSVAYVLVAYVLRYRRRVIKKNLANAFPEKSERERRKIELGFYRFFCDYIAETIKFATMSKKNIRRRMVFHGVEQLNQVFAEGQSVALLLGHYGNWEMVTSLRMWLHKDAQGGFGHIYHKLENEVMDRLFLTFRNRMGSHSIAMNETLRWLIEHDRRGEATIVGYISDQVPLWQNIHHWVNFLNQETPVFTGVERIARKMNQAVFYLDMQRVKRGYYEVTFNLITRDPGSLPEFSITEQYFSMLEKTICRAPQYWLWSHNRWKRTREEFDQRFEVVNGRVIERIKEENK